MGDIKREWEEKKKDKEKKFRESKVEIARKKEKSEYCWNKEWKKEQKWLKPY